MNLKDENVLREMNLYPLWVRKNAPAPSAIQTQAIMDVVPDVASLSQSAAQQEASPSLPQGTASPVLHSSHEKVSVLAWPALKQVVTDCTACKLRAGCAQPVMGAGDENADWFFVGEHPVEMAEDESKLLTNMLAAIQLKRGTHTYISTVIKCRPAQDSHPSADEITTCLPYLQQQIALIKPKLIVALGKTAAMALLGKDVPLGSLRGSLHEYQGIPVVVTYQPAYLLRSPLEKARAWEDLKLAVQAMQARQR